MQKFHFSLTKYVPAKTAHQKGQTEIFRNLQSNQYLQIKINKNIIVTKKKELTLSLPGRERREGKKKKEMRPGSKTEVKVEKRKKKKRILCRKRDLQRESRGGGGRGGGGKERGEKMTYQSQINQRNDGRKMCIEVLQERKTKGEGGRRETNEEGVCVEEFREIVVVQPTIKINKTIKCKKRTPPLFLEARE